MVTALAVALATPAAADDFCAALKPAVASASKGFAAIRGEADPVYPASYWRPLVLPGAMPLTTAGSPCFVLHGAIMTPPDQYHCYFPGGPGDRDSLLTAMHAMADKVSACLGPMTFEPKAAYWKLAVNGASVIVTGVLAPPELGGGNVEVVIEPAAVR